MTQPNRLIPAREYAREFLEEMRRDDKSRRRDPFYIDWPTAEDMGENLARYAPKLTIWQRFLWQFPWWRRRLLVKWNRGRAVTIK